MNVIELRRHIEDILSLDCSYRNADRLDPRVLMEQHKVIFFNLIWYFSERNLPFDLITPYEEKKYFLQKL